MEILMTGSSQIAPFLVMSGGVTPPVTLAGLTTSHVWQGCRAKLRNVGGWVLFGLAALSLLATSCATIPGGARKSGYLRAMDALRNSARPQGIPREKVFYHFQLLGLSSERHMDGGGDGLMTAWEEWRLPDGFRLFALKHTVIGRDPKVVPAAKGDSIGYSILVITEESYREPRLEPYFDNILLLDNRGRLVVELKAPIK